MKKIPYPNKSKFYPMIKDYILKLDNTKQDGIDIKVELPESEPDGYKGDYIVNIDGVQSFFETNFTNKDITRFPARIKAAALAIKDTNNIGEFHITHEKRIIAIKSVNNKINDDNKGKAWSIDEINSIVDDYMSMLFQDLKGEKYNKKSHREKLKPQLNNRTDGSIKFKHQNISAVLIDLGCPYIDEYKPRFNYQNELFQVISKKTEEIDFDLPDRIIDNYLNKSNISSEKFPPALIEVLPPTTISSKINPYEKIEFGRKTKNNYALIENNNKNLGRKGEELVLEFEKQRLTKLKLDVSKIQWISEIKGDDEGYDILSLNDDGSARYIEVKTTTQGIDFHFFISGREVEFSRRNKNNYFIYRVFNLNKSPKIYVKKGYILDSFELFPTEFKASLKVTNNP
jgi:hypothetical protein